VRAPRHAGIASLWAGQLLYRGSRSQRAGVRAKRSIPALQPGARDDTPLLATNDLHYVAAADADAQDVLLCVQTGKTLDEPKRMKFDSQEYYLKTPDEMARLFPELPEALANTVRVAEQCEVEIDFGAASCRTTTCAGVPLRGRVSVSLCLEGARERFGGE